MKARSKATHEGLRRHNLHLMLRAVYSGQADNRAALAQQSGLAKPTVSELVGELMRLGLLAEEGTGQSTESGGKRPRLLRFVPTAQQVIGAAVEPERVSAVLANLDGQVVARHSAALDGAQGDAALRLLNHAINGLVAQLDAPLLCLGVGVPGAVDEASGIVRESPLPGWRDLPLADVLGGHYGVPTYAANSTELAAMAQHADAENGDARTLVAVLIDQTIEVGVVFGGSETHFGSDIGQVRVLNAAGALAPLEATLTLPALRQRAQALGWTAGGAELSYLGLRRALVNGDAAAAQLYDEVAAQIAQVCAWVVALLRPDQIALAGPIVALGPALLERVVQAARAAFPAAAVDTVAYTLTDAESLSATGAVAYALQQELGIRA